MPSASLDLQDEIVILRQRLLIFPNPFSYKQFHFQDQHSGKADMEENWIRVITFSDTDNIMCSTKVY